MDSELKCWHTGDVAVVALNRPQRANALTVNMLRTLHHHLAAELDNAGALVITGTGTTFCAGADLDELSRGDDGALRTLSWDTFELLQDFPLPVVCALNGPAIAGGVELVLSSDLRVGTEQSYLQPRGLQWGAVTCTRLARHLPLGIATSSIWLERPISAMEAARWGLLTDVVQSPDMALTLALELAATLANAPRGALIRSRALLRSNTASWKDMVGLQADESLRGWEEGSSVMAKIRSGHTSDSGNERSDR